MPNKVCWPWILSSSSSTASMVMGFSSWVLMGRQVIRTDRMMIPWNELWGDHKHAMRRKTRARGANMALKIVGTGLGRTGTKSLQAALNLLGFGPCHHMVEVFARPESMALWIEAAAGRPDWDA